MTITIITLFPEMFSGPFDYSIVKRASGLNKVKINFVNLRNFAVDERGSVDDHPYGGGAGMVLRIEPVFGALNSIDGSGKARKILLTPQGKPFSQKDARRLSKFDNLILICGHYEGVDERIRKYLADEEISLGDFVLTGGEIPAMALTDAVVRLIPGVLSKKEANKDESFSLKTADGSGVLLEYPQYTRPSEFKGWKVPKVLLSGNHKKISEWRSKEALKKTLQKRPDLISKKR